MVTEIYKSKRITAMQNNYVNSPNTHQKPSNKVKRLEKSLRRKVGQAIQDYNMIEEGDHVMVCISGGKDSFVMLDLLTKLRQKAPVNFQITAVNLDQNHPGFPSGMLEKYLKGLAIPYRMVKRDTYKVVKRIVPEGKTMCGLCSRLRRGILYSCAKEEGMNKIALGHHKDDIVETLFLNMFHGGTLKAMPPKLLSDDGNHIVIRPLSYCREKDIAQYARVREFPLIPCDLCGSQDNLQRQAIKRMLIAWDEKYPGRTNSIFRSISHVAPSQLADSNLYDFVSISNKDSVSKSKSWLPEKSEKTSSI